MTYIDLPTVEQAQQALAAINDLREKIGLERIDKFDWDHGRPDSPTRCLSANALFHSECALWVSSDTVYNYGHGDERQLTNRDALVEYLQPEYPDHENNRWLIPDDILRVTDPFDQCAKGLKERLTEAGVI